MSSRSEALARKVQQANDELLATIQQTTSEQWGAKCADGDWTQGFAGYHAATSIGNIAAMVKGIASGESFPPVTFADIDARNYAFHQEHAGCTKPEALDMVRTNSPVAVQIVAGLSDAELDRQAALLIGMPAVTVEQIVEMLLVGHPTGHRESITKAR